MSYSGKKWRYAGESEYCDSNKQIHRYNDLGFRTTERKFVMTMQYKIYLANKRAEEEYMDYVKLKNKLEYQQKHYGAADEYDIAEFLRLTEKLFPHGGAFK